MDIDKLQIEIQANANDAVSGIDKLSITLGKLKSAVNITGMKTLSSNIGALAKATATLNQTNSGKINSIAAALNSLTNIKRGDFGYIVNQIKKLPDAFSALRDIDASVSQGVVAALKPLESLQKTNLGSTITQLRKLPDTMKMFNNLPDEELAKFASRVRQLASALVPLANEMQKVANGFNAFPAKLQRAFSATSKANSNVGNVWGGITGQAIGWGVLYGYAQRLSSGLAECVTQSNKYVEDLNLFTVAMGDYADAALDYANKASDALGIDPAEFMRNQGVIQQIVSGFGVAGESAATMSKNMTQLGYDISSFFNIPVADAMTKLESGIAGELEPLRRIGYALDQTTLQQIAYGLGIDQSVQKMNQAEKAHLRYIAIMQQSGNVMYDMGRTIMSPANAMRVMQAQITQLKRAIGNILIPALTAILPYAIAVVEVMTQIAQSIALAFGFKMPKIDYSSVKAADVAIGGVGDIADDVSDKVGGIGDAGKKAGDKIKKSLLLPFDELNMLAQESAASAGNSGSGGVGSAFDGVDLPSYDFLDFASDELKKKVAEVKKEMQKWLPVIKAVGIALAAAIGFAVIGKIINGIKGLTTAIGNGGALGAFAKLKAGVLGAVAGFTVGFSSMYAMTIGGNDLANSILWVTAAATGMGAVMYAILGPIGLVIGVVSTVIGAILGWWEAEKQLSIEIANTGIMIDNGGIKISDYVDNVIASISPIREQAQATIEMGKSFDSARQNIADTVVEIMNLLEKISAAPTVTSESVEALKSHFNSLHDQASTVFNNMHTMVQEDLIRMMQTAKGETATSIQGMLSQLYLLQENGNASLAGLKSEINSTIMEMQGMDTSSPEYSNLKAHLDEVTQKYAAVSGATKEVDYNWQIAVGNFNQQKIDFQSPQAAAEAINKLNEDGTAALGELDQSMSVKLKNLDDLMASTLVLDPNADVTVFDDIRAGYEQNYNEQKASIENTLSSAIGEMNGYMSTQMQEGVAKAVSEASPPLQALASIAAFFTGRSQEDILREQFQTNVQESWNDVIDAMQSVLDTNNIPATVTTNGGAFGTAVTESVSGGMRDQKALDEITASGELIIGAADTALYSSGQFGSPSKKTEQYGKWWVEGFGDGISSGLSLLSNSHKGMTDDIDQKLTSFWQFGSPSRKTFQYGLWLIQGLANSITQNASLAINAITRLMTDMQNVFDTKKEAFVNSMRNIMTEIKQTVEQNSNLSGSMGKSLDDMANTIRDNTSVAGSFNTFFNHILDKMDDFTGRFRKSVNDMLGNWQSAMNSVNISASGKMSYSKMPTINIPRFASGGFPDMGSLFIANEVKPEMVGTINGKTAVANNDQIVQAVATGVARAVAGVMGGGTQGEREVVLNIDGRELGRVVINEINAETRRTGDMPLEII